MQSRIDAESCTAETIQRRDETLTEADELKRTVEQIRQFDRDLGRVLASSGDRTRKTAIGGASIVDWALIQIPEKRRGTNEVRVSP